MDTTNSTNYGKAYEYACILALQELVKPHRNVEVEENSSLLIAKQNYENDTPEKSKNDMLLSAAVGISSIIKMEPRILEDGEDVLMIFLQPDNVAKEQGDIRDVIIIRRSIEWEIGISVKHNHAALKHSRLSPYIDFGHEWMGINCSENYFNEIKTIFDKTEKWKEQKEKWSKLKDKEGDVYIPLLTAFIKEFNSLYKQNNNIVGKLVEYLIGSNGRDYYKLIHNNNHTVTVMPFNIHGSLNFSAEKQCPSIVIPKIELPDRIIELTFKENSKTTVILTMNKGWSMSFRIHNAAKLVESSLKFDIKLQSKPEDIFYINTEW